MQQPRDHWGSRLGFVLAAAGSAVGLGNLWKFPYITFDNEGGAFVLVYLICIAAVGLPIMTAEILIGRKTQMNPVGALAEVAGPAWSWVGGIGVLAGFVILSYYTVIAGWTLRYVVDCIGWSLNGYTPGASSPEAFGGFVTDGAQQIGLAALFMVATMTVIYRGIGKGIEAVARVLLPILFAILLLLLGSALTMDGSGTALRFIFEPRFSELEPAGVLEALGHAFFTLSLGMGAMITYGSYMRRNESVVRSSVAVVVLDTLIALVATVIMFSVIFSVDGLRDSIGRSTAGMLFITLPEQFYGVVPGGRVLAPLFYILVAFAALTSTISLMEVIVSYFIDRRGMARKSATTLVGVTVFTVSIFCALSLGAVSGLSNFRILGYQNPGVLAHLDYLASNWLLPVGGFLLTLAAGWFMTREDTERELMDETTPSWFRYGIWRLFIRYVAPVAVGAVIAMVISGKDFT